MRKLHLTIGTLGLLGFLMTGAYLRWHSPAMNELDPLTRMLLRSRHVYLLLSSLLNLAVGSYFVTATTMRRQVVQRVGSVLLIAAPFIIAAAFFLEADRGNFRGRLAVIGMELMLAGTLLELASTLRQRADDDRQQGPLVEPARA